MSRGQATRSKLHLRGSIRDYSLGEKSDTMPDPTPAPAESETESIHSLLTMMAKTLSSVTEQRNNAGGGNPKLENCPSKRKTTSLDAWVQEVLLWDDCNRIGVSIGAKKYLKFVECVRSSEESDDLKNLVEVEFVENHDFEKKDDAVISTMIQKIKEKLGQTDIEKCSEAWIDFINIKQEPEEASVTFLSRFEKVEQQLRNVNISIPNKALAIHLMNRSNMEEQSKENVLTKTNLSSESEIYPSMKKSIREMKGKLTAKEKPNADHTKSVDPSKIFYGRHENRGRSKSRSKFNNRRVGDRSKSGYRGESWRYKQNEENKNRYSGYDRSGINHRGDYTKRDSRRDERDHSRHSRRDNRDSS